MQALMNTRILASLAMIVFVAAAAAGGTGAFFSDTETSTGNTFTAGDIDLQIDSVAHYNGMVCTLVDGTYHYIPEGDVTLNQTPGNNLNQPIADVDMDAQAEWDAYNLANPAQFPAAGTACTGTWPMGNLDENTLGMDEFFNFTDIKPGDNGENTVSIHVGSNDAWMCVSLENVAGADPVVSQTEPEMTAGDVTFGSTLADSELDENLFFFAWRDDGDNIYEVGETPFGNPVAASTLVNQKWALADSTTGGIPVEGDTTGYIGLAWCAGAMSVVGQAISCDGAGMGNLAQTDSWSADLAFYVEQSRNNAAFRCNPIIN